MEKLNALSELLEALMRSSFIIKNYENIPRSYNTELMLYPMEVHILQAIYYNKGITSKELITKFGRTKGAISQQIKKLNAKSLIIKIPNNENHKTIGLYPTDEGVKVARLHEQFDKFIAREITKKLDEFSEEDILKFNKLINIISEDFLHRINK